MIFKLWPAAVPFTIPRPGCKSSRMCWVGHLPVAGIGEVSARGAALLAFEALGVIKDLKDIPVFIERTCYPDEERHTIYRRTIERQQRLYEKLIKDDR